MNKKIDPSRVLSTIEEKWPDLLDQAMLFILCGPGDNGADGFELAAYCTDQGYLPHVFGWDWRGLYTQGVSLPFPRTRAWEAARRWMTYEMGLEDLKSGSLGDDLCIPMRLIIVDAMYSGQGDIRDNDVIHEMLQTYWEHWDFMCNAGGPSDVHCVSLGLPCGYSIFGGGTAGQAFEADLCILTEPQAPDVSAALKGACDVVVQSVNWGTSDE